MKCKRSSDARKLDQSGMHTMRMQALKAVENGQPVAEVAKTFGVAERTLYRWLARFAAESQRGAEESTQNRPSADHPIFLRERARVDTNFEASAREHAAALESGWSEQFHAVDALSVTVRGLNGNPTRGGSYDQLHHQAGDDLLRRIVGRLTVYMRDGDAQGFHMGRPKPVRPDRRRYRGAVPPRPEAS